jgi:hypothetical protein
MQKAYKIDYRTNGEPMNGGQRFQTFHDGMKRASDFDTTGFGHE